MALHHNHAMRLSAFAALFLACAALAREPLPAPEDWRRESFEFPLKFAPSIGLQGSEHVRFAPGWSDFASERGFSYVFLWDVKEVAGPALTVHGLEFALGAYFDGLMNTAAEVRKIEPGAAATVVNFHPMRAVPEWREAYAGEIHTWNAFAKAEPLRLNVEATKRSCAGAKAQVFFAISKAPRNAAIWEELRAIRGRTACA
jgi:hypothetical protein